MLSSEELKQYNRQIILPELGIDGQEKLKAAKVLMIGAGGLGCPVLQYLVAAGIGTIGIVDDDVVDTSNLHRQILYSVADVGFPKAVIAKKKLEQINPFIKLIDYPERITTANAARLIGGYDLIVDGSDNFTTRYLVNDICVALQKPLVFGSIFKFEGHISVFNYQGRTNYRDVFPEAPPENEVPNCSEIGVIGVLPGIVGTYMANEVIKIVCQIGETYSGKLLTIDALNNSVSVFNIPKRITGFQPKNPIENSVTKIKKDESVQEIELNQLMLLINSSPEKICLVDVREDYEYEEYNIGGINISLHELPEKFNELPKDRKLIFCCQTGHRSRMAVKIAARFFDGELYSVKNGINN